MTEAIKKSILFIISTVAFFGLRFAYRLRCPEIVDNYGYFERAMIQTKEQSTAATGSGLVNAYLGALSGLFRFVGNRIEAVWGYQLLMQGTAIILLVVGCYLLFGRIGAYLCAAVSAVLPYLIVSLMSISPENFLLLCCASVFLLISIIITALKKCMGLSLKREKAMSGLFGLFSKKKNTEIVDTSEVADRADEEPVLDKEIKVTYLENPLPVPKKHEKRTMDFDMEGKADDFDIQIDENDDFDV